MDLWIRSQDRETIMQISRVDYSSGHVVVYQPGDDVEILVGTYKSKKRALEVLDEIHEHIGYINVEVSAGRGGELDFQSDIVYEMPKE